MTVPLLIPALVIAHLNYRKDWSDLFCFFTGVHNTCMKCFRPRKHTSLSLRQADFKLHLISLHFSFHLSSSGSLCLGFMSMSVACFFLGPFKSKAVLPQLSFSCYFKRKQSGKPSIILSLCIVQYLKGNSLI